MEVKGLTKEQAIEKVAEINARKGTTEELDIGSDV